MKILYVTAQMLPSYHASSVHVANMASELAKIGNTVTVICNKGQGNTIWEHYGIAESGRLKFESVKFDAISPLRRITKMIGLSKKNDLIYTRWILGAFFATFFCKNKIIVEFHAKQSGIMNKITYSRLFNCKRIVRYAFITKSLLEDFAKEYDTIRKYSIVLPDGATIHESDVNNSHNTPLSCGYIGSLYQGKGVDTILRIASKMPNTNFIIVGGADEEIENYKNQFGVQSNVTWYGQMEHKNAMKVMKKFDIALLPNKQNVYVGRGTNIGAYTSPNKLFEYMAYKKIIVASKLEVLQEILIDKENALLVDENDIDEWVNTIKWVQANIRECDTIRERAYSELINNYTWNCRCQKLLNDIEKVKRAEKSVH